MDNTLQKTFLTFTANQNSMDNRTFVKLMKDCKLLNNALTTTDLDINFAKVKDKAEKKITFDQFKQALELCAPKRSPWKLSPDMRLSRRFDDGLDGVTHAEQTLDALEPLRLDTP